MTGESSTLYDVAVIGGGVVGTAVARLLSLHDVSVAIVEQGPDVGVGTSKANTAILHTGFDATPGSEEARLVARGYALLRHYASTVGIAVEQTGGLLVAWDDEQAATLPRLRDKAEANGYRFAEVVDADVVRDLEPHLGDGVAGGMLVPDEHIIDPWSTPIAFATEAVLNGCTLLLDHRVIGVDHHALVSVARQSNHQRHVRISPRQRAVKRRLAEHRAGAQDLGTGGNAIDGHVDGGRRRFVRRS